ncbi:MAG TPA: hypothetical protein VEL75_07975, partial [Candidatus Methylomirabilis sp.]|nr:hypothetical protein [Candidatus Methylomirabilis sp.]
FLRRLALLNRRERVREQWLEEALPALARGRLPALSRQHILGADLMGPGPEASIRTDPQALAAARSLAEQIGAQLAAYQGPIRGWRGTIQEDLVRLVRAGGGHVVFFDPPESEVFSRSYRAPIRREDAAAFARQVEKWGACMVRPAFSYRDEDLPDLWHLRPERVDEYTRALTASWLDTCAS